MLAQRRLGRCSGGSTPNTRQLLPPPARNMGRSLQQAYTHLWKLQLSEGVSKLKVGLRFGTYCMLGRCLALPPRYGSTTVITVLHTHFVTLHHDFGVQKRTSQILTHASRRIV